jgi:lysophospholipase L1-like esterase
VVATAGVGLSLIATVGSATGAGAATSTSAFYLDLGASISVGMQPLPTLPRGQATNRGYANDLVALESAKGISLQLTQLGCPGESLATMIAGGSACYKAGDTQLADAVAFLAAHHDQTGLVTLDIGFNTFRTCLNQVSASMTCATAQSALVHQQLAKILTTLTAAAGPNVTFVGVGHYNPYLVNSLLGPTGQAFAASSVEPMRLFNQTLRDTYASFQVPTVNVAQAFGAGVTTPVTAPGFATMPTDAAKICTLTWMCQPAPYGPNIHPNDAGYQVMARALEAVLPATL